MAIVNLRISGRLYAGFSIVVVLGVALASFAVWQLWAIQSKVERMAVQSNNNIRAVQISAELQAIRRGILRYAFDYDEPSFAEAEKRLLQVGTLLEVAAKTTTSEDRRQGYLQTATDVVQIKEKRIAFGNAVQQFVAAKAILFSDGDKMAAEVQKFVDAAEKTPFVSAAAGLETKILLVRVANWRLLATRDAKGVDTFKTNLEKAQKQIADLEKADLPANLVSLLASLKPSVVKYASAFEAASTNMLLADQIYYKVITPTVIGAIDRIEGVKTRLDEAFKITTAATEERIAGTITMQEVVALLAALLGGLIAFVIARGITRPLTGLTAVMNLLSGGRTDVTVPGSERTDELGTMAQAVEVFKQNAIEKNGLEAAQAISRAAQTRRQEEVDQLIGFFGRSMSGSFKSLSGTSADMSRTSSSLEAAAQTTGTQASQVLSEVEQTSLNIQTVAAASQELSASISEIGRQAGESARGSSVAMQQAEDVGVKVAELREAAEQIGNVVKLINSIAGQTNLLALNATIEAARAGEAGRGFAVVAGEVKALAEQTAKATSDIAAQVASIQAATNGTAEAIEGITGTIRGVNETAVAIATAVEQQGAATQEIARSIESVTVNAASMNRSMVQVQGAVDVTSGNAADVKRTTSALSVDTGILSTEVQDFLSALSNLGESRQLRAVDVNLQSTATASGRNVTGRVRKVSPGMVLFDGPLQVAPGTLVELQIDTLDRALRGRFVDRVPAGCQIQLLLNHDHLNFMEGAMTHLSAAA
jgi:methyl-accepting chemotaxis protein